MQRSIEYYSDKFQKNVSDHHLFDADWICIEVNCTSSKLIHIERCQRCIVTTRVFGWYGDRWYQSICEMETWIFI